VCSQYFVTVIDAGIVSGSQLICKSTQLQVILSPSELLPSINVEMRVRGNVRVRIRARVNVWISVKFRVRAQGYCQCLVCFGAKLTGMS